ncbi:GPP34 family phosphoprotein [Streptomyces krungchingensis]|uniref:GOLPH3/VPS74 family protein n=1 Tax=Streptomyces krungchingensis TaxID=1565034 RepID=UPI003CEFFBAF
MPNGPLSLPARLYLLAQDPGEPGLGDAPGLDRLVRAGALADLAGRGLLVDDDGIVTPADADSRTGDTVLDELLELVAESRPRTWPEWVSSRARLTLDAVRAQLADEGYLRAERRRVLGLFSSVDYGLERVPAAQALHARARQVLAGPLPAAEVPGRDAALVVLAAAAGLRMLAPPDGRQVPSGRVDELAGRAGAETPALMKAVREVRDALAVASPAPGR